MANQEKFPAEPWRRNASAWGLLIALTVALCILLEALRLPAASLLGAIVAAVVVAMRETRVHLPASLFIGAQSVIGCMIARPFTIHVMRGLLDNWLLAMSIVIVVIVCGFALGWLLTIRQVLPGTTGIWGSSPGAAMAMVLMCEAYGADMRLVAFMQYLRVIAVSLLAAGVGIGMGVDMPPSALFSLKALFPPTDWGAMLLTLVLALASALLGHFTRIPAGALLLPMVAAALAHNTGLMTIELPPWLLLLCFVLVGWCIGARFDRPILVYALRVLPKVLGATLLLVFLCLVIAALLVYGAGLDPLTAYLATSPGGLDAVAIIAFSSNADLVFVMAIQAARLFIVLLTGPYLAKVATRIVKKKLNGKAGG